jgi:RNA polymerase sigma-70 factor (ECF subfamily)
VANRCKSHLSRRDTGDVSLDEAPPLADPSDNEAAVERAEQMALVERALGALSPEKREAFILKHVEGMSYEEMAVVTGERIPALKMRVHRAREALLEALEEYR